MHLTENTNEFYSEVVSTAFPFDNLEQESSCII